MEPKTRVRHALELQCAQSQRSRTLVEAPSLHGPTRFALRVQLVVHARADQQPHVLETRRLSTEQEVAPTPQQDSSLPQARSAYRVALPIPTSSVRDRPLVESVRPGKTVPITILTVSLQVPQASATQVAKRFTTAMIIRAGRIQSRGRPVPMESTPLIASIARLINRVPQQLRRHVHLALTQRLEKWTATMFPTATRKKEMAP